MLRLLQGRFAAGHDSAGRSSTSTASGQENGDDANATSPHFAAAGAASAASSDDGLLSGGGILPQAWGLPQQIRMPHELGVGFIDVALVPGNAAADLPGEVMAQWREHLYARLSLHMAAAAQAVSCKVGHHVRHAPYPFAFTGWWPLCGGSICVA